MNRAGFPPTTVQGSTSRVTTAPAAMTAPLPITTPGHTNARAVTQADIDALKGDASDLKSQKKALQSKLDAISGDISDTMKKKENLDGQISNLSAQISNAEKQIATYASLISQTATGTRVGADLICERSTVAWR